MAKRDSFSDGYDDSAKTGGQYVDWDRWKNDPDYRWGYKKADSDRADEESKDYWENLDTSSHTSLSSNAPEGTKLIDWPFLLMIAIFGAPLFILLLYGLLVGG